MCFFFFFHFFDIFIFQVVRGGKRVKNAQNENNNISHAISQEQYSIWSWFFVHLSKVMIFLGVFFIFWKFWFFWLLRGWGRGVKVQKNSVCCASYLRNHTSYDFYLFYLWYSCVKWYLLFLKFWLSGLLGGEGGGRGGYKGQKIAQNDKKFCLVRWYFRNHTSYDRHLWYTSVKWYFFKILIFWVIRRVKGQKMAKWQKTLFFHFISEEPYMVLIYGAHV